MGNAVVNVRPQHHVFLSVLLNAHGLSVIDRFALFFGEFYHIWLLCEHLSKGLTLWTRRCSVMATAMSIHPTSSRIGLPQGTSWKGRLRRSLSSRSAEMP